MKSRNAVRKEEEKGEELARRIPSIGLIYNRLGRACARKVSTDGIDCTGYLGQP